MLWRKIIGTSERKYWELLTPSIFIYKQASDCLCADWIEAGLEGEGWTGALTVVQIWVMAQQMESWWNQDREQVPFVGLNYHKILACSFNSFILSPLLLIIEDATAVAQILISFVVWGQWLSFCRSYSFVLHSVKWWCGSMCWSQQGLTFFLALSSRDSKINEKFSQIQTFKLQISSRSRKFNNRES